MKTLTIFLVFIFLTNGRTKSIAETSLAIYNNTEVSNREGRFFPFFTIIRFENVECPGVAGISGTCFTRRECKDLRGFAGERCASRRGVCCVVQRNCGQSTNVNNTYFSNPGYPNAITSSMRCSISVTRCNPKICQLRIDYLDVVTGQPDDNGTCGNDALTIETNGAPTTSPLCGILTGQHTYIDFNGNETINLSMLTSIANGGTGRWNIKLTQIPCEKSENLAPNGCSMYYTGVSGTVKSFNYDTSINNPGMIMMNGPTRQLSNKNYGVCVRMEAGYCGIQWSQTPGDLYSFTVSEDLVVNPNIVGTPLGVLTGSSCLNDYIVIPSPIYLTGTSPGSDRFCGLGFQPVRSFSKPFVLTVVQNGNEVNDTLNRGFSLDYMQIPC